MTEAVAAILRALNDGPPAVTPADRRRGFAKLCSFAGEPDSATRWRTEQLVTRDGQEIDLRFYEGARHERGSALLLYFHGGGYVAGDLETHHAALSQLAARTTALVVHVGYRRGPEHRYPTALHDAEDALAQLLARANELGFDRRRVVVGGDSAGGNLAAVLGLTRRQVIAHQILLYPTLDAFFTADSWRQFPAGFIASAPDAREFNLLYARAEGDFAEPLFSPVLAKDLANVPPATLIAGEYDPARGDSELYASKLKAAGVRAEFYEAPGLIHGFIAMTAKLEGARIIHRRIAELCDALPARD